MLLNKIENKCLLKMDEKLLNTRLDNFMILMNLSEEFMISDIVTHDKKKKIMIS